MESFFSFSTLFNLVLTVIWFISGIRDLQGKDPFLDLPFNQYHRDPEYRAFWQKNVDQIECTAKDRQDAEETVKVLLFVLTAPSGAGAIVQVPDAAVQKQHTQHGVQPIPVRKLQIHGGPFPAVNPHYGSSFRKRQDKEGLPRWRCRR